MRALLALLTGVPVTIFALANCGSGASAPGDPANATDSNRQPMACHPTCGAAGDCGTAGDPLYDPSHFACQAGRCQWLGCRSASECSASAQGGNFLCQASHTGPPSCVPSCRQPADCVAPGASSPGLQDAGHFACVAGGCVWKGCRSAAECATATQSQRVACEQPAGAPTPICVPTCTAPSDCVIPGTGTLGDAHHYACKGGRCQWLGCRSTLECTTALASKKLVCE